tara:strand:- start:396 stop:935 length:540 start_codon:yes stop_codon:yes gene_type:complete
MDKRNNNAHLEAATIHNSGSNWHYKETSIMPNLMISLTVKDAPAALEYYQKALGAKVVYRMDGPDGSVLHSTLTIADCMIYLSGEDEMFQAVGQDTHDKHSSCLLCIQSDDPDVDFAKAITVGGKVIMPVQDSPWGSRSGIMIDPYGYRWTIGNESGELPPPDKIGEMMASWKPIFADN